MSRIGKQAVLLPSGVTAQIRGQEVVVRGPRGELRCDVHPYITVRVAEGALHCAPAEVRGRAAKRVPALWGTARARLVSIVVGVTEGFRKRLELHGVGYRAAVKGGSLELMLGFSHPVTVAAPEGITFSVENEVITVEGNDAVLVGQVAADVRALRKPEPYKGKGVRYVGERVRRKVGKVAGTAT